MCQISKNFRAFFFNSKICGTEQGSASLDQEGQTEKVEAGAGIGMERPDGIKVRPGLAA